MPIWAHYSVGGESGIADFYLARAVMLVRLMHGAAAVEHLKGHIGEEI